jgi:hypothetical protein
LFEDEVVGVVSDLIIGLELYLILDIYIDLVDH